MVSSRRQPHLKAQSQYFDTRADIFLQPIPDPIRKKTLAIVQSADLKADAKVLDVGTGAGVLIQHFLEEGVEAGGIVGCDLSTGMLNNAKERFPHVFFWQGDVADLKRPLPESFPEHIDAFDAVFFNACFGNMWDQNETLKAALGLLSSNGRIVISHPLGNRFVKSLHTNEPHIVPHLLPDQTQLESWSQPLGFEVTHFENRDDFYLAILRKADE